MRANVPGSGPGWRGAHFVWGGPCVDPRAHTKWATLVRPLLGPQGDLVTRAVLRARAGPVVANGAGPLAPFHSGSYICSVHQLHICTPPCPRQLVSSARAARYSLQEGARRPTGHSRGARPRPLSIPVPVCLCGCLYMARAPPAYIDPGVCVSVCLSVCLSVYIYIYICMYVHGTGGPCRPRSVQMSGGVHVRVGVYIYIYTSSLYICIYIHI